MQTSQVLQLYLMINEMVTIDTAPKVLWTITTTIVLQYTNQKGGLGEKKILFWFRYYSKKVGFVQCWLYKHIIYALVSHSFHSSLQKSPISRTWAGNHITALFEIWKSSQFTCEKGFWLSADGVRICACKWNLHHFLHKWNVEAGGSSTEIFNQYLRCQWGQGPLAPVGEVKWLWCEMTGAFTEAILPFPSLSFTQTSKHTHTHTAPLHCSYWH